MLHLQAEQLSKKTVLREKQLDDAKKQNIQEEQGKAEPFLIDTTLKQILSNTDDND
jgi:hypothetical protein